MNGGKNKMYKTIYDLNRAELNELKDEMFWGVDNSFLEENNINNPWEITDEMLFAHFGGISFVEEDFMCNI